MRIRGAAGGSAIGIFCAFVLLGCGGGGPGPVMAAAVVR